MSARQPLNLSAWNEWTADFMMRNGITQTELARRLNLAPGSVQTRLCGISPPPLGTTLIRWMIALRLDEGECRMFQRLSYLGHCPPEVRAYVHLALPE